MLKLKIAIVQMEIEDGNPSKNLKNALEILNQINDGDELPDIVCLPELFTTGYDLRNVKHYAQKIPGKTINDLSNISRNKYHVIGSILEEEKGNYYNTAFILNKNGGIIGKYRKTHLFSPMLEKEFLTSGEKLSTFTIPDLDDLKVGLAICYDIRFPELFRIMALDGADIIFVPSEFPNPKRKIWKTLIHARAIENQIYVIGVNRVGKGKSDSFFGYSLVSNGDLIEHLEDKPTVKLFEVNLETLVPIRKAIPLLKDRRVDLFKL